MTGFIIFVVVMIVVSLINKAKQQSNRANGKVNPRVQALVEKIQAQQGGNLPTQFQGQYAQAAGQGGPPPNQGSTFPGQVVQSGQPVQSGNPAPYMSPYQPPAQFQPVQYTQNAYQPPAHRPQQSQLPVSNQDLDAQVRKLMNANNEVGAIRLLGEQRELGILEAQKYARSLVAPRTAPRSPDADADAAYSDSGESDEDDSRYVGSAAFAESIFNLDDREENVWASGWVDKPEPEDRSDIDELWQTVRNAPRPGTTS
ncbi:hypothetical protein [Kribbella sp. NPDC000426]|uniref:hypothetical protein n=1 Tax=Kribbella sp. NPDC000426 TaxID=3154255 RepID=UPI0033267ED7